MTLSDFSVIIPTRNRDLLLKRAVKSALCQHAVTVEVIVVDDGDWPEDSKKLEVYCNENRVKYLKTDGNKGGAFARNIGLENASNSLIAFLDDDDYWADDKLQKQAVLMADSDIGMCYTGVMICKEESLKRYRFRKPSCNDQFKAIMKKNFIGTTSSIVVRKSVLNQIGGFDISLPALQDYDLYIRILKKWKVSWTQEPLTFYDDHSYGNRVSSSRQRYLNAVNVMRKKYKEEKYFAILNRSLMNIQLLKICRSRKFLLETFVSIFKNIKNEND